MSIFIEMGNYNFKDKVWKGPDGDPDMGEATLYLFLDTIYCHDELCSIDRENPQDTHIEHICNLKKKLIERYRDIAKIIPVGNCVAEILCETHGVVDPERLPDRGGVKMTAFKEINFTCPTVFARLGHPGWGLFQHENQTAILGRFLFPMSYSGNQERFLHEHIPSKAPETCSEDVSLIMDYGYMGDKRKHLDFSFVNEVGDQNMSQIIFIVISNDNLFVYKLSGHTYNLRPIEISNMCADMGGGGCQTPKAVLSGGSTLHESASNKVLKRKTAPDQPPSERRSYARGEGGEKQPTGEDCLPQHPPRLRDVGEFDVSYSALIEKMNKVISEELELVCITALIVSGNCIEYQFSLTDGRGAPPESAAVELELGLVGSDIYYTVAMGEYVAKQLQTHYNPPERHYFASPDDEVQATMEFDGVPNVQGSINPLYFIDGRAHTYFVDAARRWVKEVPDLETALMKYLKLDKLNKKEFTTSIFFFGLLCGYSPIEPGPGAEAPAALAAAAAAAEAEPGAAAEAGAARPGGGKTTRKRRRKRRTKKQRKAKRKTRKRRKRKRSRK